MHDMWAAKWNSERCVGEFENSPTIMGHLDIPSNVDFILQTMGSHWKGSHPTLSVRRWAVCWFRRGGQDGPLSWLLTIEKGCSWRRLEEMRKQPWCHLGKSVWSEGMPLQKQTLRGRSQETWRPGQARHRSQGNRNMLGRRPRVQPGFSPRWAGKPSGDSGLKMGSSNISQGELWLLCVKKALEWCHLTVI